MTAAYVAPPWPDAAIRAFAKWCAEQNLIEDYDAPHGQAFRAGWLEGVNWKPVALPVEESEDDLDLRY